MQRATKDLIEIVERKSSREGYADKVQELLRQGADIMAPTNIGPMIHSVIAEEERERPIRPHRADNCLRLIQVLKKEASDRLTAQVLSHNGGDVEEMRRLIQLMADCYQSSQFQPLGLLGSLLTQTTAPIRLPIVQFLIESDLQTRMSLTLVDGRQQTCLSLAKNNSKCPQDVVKYLQRQLDLILIRIPFEQPNIDPNEVMVWIRRGANIEAVDDKCNTVLSNAVLADNLNLVRSLLTAGSNTAHSNVDGLTPLQIAQRATPRNLSLLALLEGQHKNTGLEQLIKKRRSELNREEVSDFLKKGHDINATFANNDSPLHLLVANEGTPEMIKAFVDEYHADISKMNVNGYRPIETCILLDKDPFARLQTFFGLSKMTTDLFHNSKLNKSILQFATEQNRSEAAKIIQNELNLRLWNCIARANTKEENNKTIMSEFNQLLNYGAQINHKHQDEEHGEWTVLHLACKTTTHILVDYLVHYLKADYTAQNHHGDYPISIAAEYGHQSIVEYLRSLPKSNLNVSNNNRETPLHLATKNHHLHVVQYLVKWGADHQARNRSTQTSLDIANASVPKNKEEINHRKLILFLEQLIYPSSEDGSLRPSSNAIKPSLDLDTCELVATVSVNPIHLTKEDTKGILGPESRGFLSGAPNDNLHDAAKHGHFVRAQTAIGHGADIHHRKNNRTPHEVARTYENKYNRDLTSTAPNTSDYRLLQSKIVGCQQIAHMIQQIAQTKIVEAIDEPNPVYVKAYHQAGAILVPDLLYRACQAKDNVEIVDYLINESANIYQALINDSSSACPYRTAKQKKLNKVVTYLKYRLSLECTKAIKENNLQQVKKLISAGASVDMHDTNNLNHVLQSQNLEMIQLLCDHGAKMPSNWLWTETIVLEPAVSQPWKQEVVSCINQCLINRRLRFSAASGDLNSLIQCQRLGADINSTNCRGSTALLCSIQHGNYFPIVHALVSCGTSMLHSNEDESMSLINQAKEKNYDHIAKYLSKKLNQQFLSAIINNDRQSADRFAKLGADFNAKDEHNRTALHYAVKDQGVDLVEWLCQFSDPAVADINGDYPITLAVEKGDFLIVKYFITKHPMTKLLTNKDGLTPLQIAQKHKFKRIAQLIENGPDVPGSVEDQDEPAKLDRETLLQTCREGPITTIQQFINECYESREERRKLCLELIQVAEKAKQLEMAALLQEYYDTKLKNEPLPVIEPGDVVTLSKHHNKILFASLTGMSTLIANSPNTLDPADPQTYVDLFSCLMTRTEKRAEELQKVTNEQEMKKLVEQDQNNIREELAKVNEEMENITANKKSVQDQLLAMNRRLHEQEDLTATQRKAFAKEKESLKQNFASYESALVLAQRQQEETLNRKATMNLIKRNYNLSMFYQTIQNRLQALFHGVLAAQGGYLQTKSPEMITFLNQIPLMSLVSTGIKAVFGPVLSKMNEKEQKKEWHNISYLGNIEELTRAASETAGLITLYYREQIQIIDPWRRIKGSNALNKKIFSLKQAYEVRPEAPEEISIVLTAEYLLTWMIDALKLGNERIDSAKPLPQQLWQCVAQKDPFEQGNLTKMKDSLGISIGQMRIPLKRKNNFNQDVLEHVQLRYLIGCASVLANDGYIFQYNVSRNSQENEIEDLEIFGYVYTAPFTSDENVFKSIIQGRHLKQAKRDADGNILTRFKDIVQHAQTYTLSDDSHNNQLSVYIQTANQVAQILKQQPIFVDHKDLTEQLSKTQETIELTVDVLREDIQEKTNLFQISIDAAHEQIIKESETNRETMKKDNQLLYEQNRKELKAFIKEMQENLQRVIEQSMHEIRQEMQHQVKQILSIAETAQVQSQQAIKEANQATKTSQQMLNKTTEAAASAQSLAQLAEQQRQGFISKINACETTVRETAVQQKQLLERNIAEIRTKIDEDLESARRAAQESADRAEQLLLSVKDIQKMANKQLDIQGKETAKAKADGRESRQFCDRAAADARKAADAATTALTKVNNIHEKVERVLRRVEELINK